MSKKHGALKDGVIQRRGNKSGTLYKKPGSNVWFMRFSERTPEGKRVRYPRRSSDDTGFPAYRFRTFRRINILRQLHSSQIQRSRLPLSDVVQRQVPSGLHREYRSSLHYLIYLIHKKVFDQRSRITNAVIYIQEMTYIHSTKRCQCKCGYFL